ncbi:uncharacterized protein LOC123712064 isoform X1 [Pieris brassicae]|uniref:uncharacterized protein LOC123712064 isoform X1 n=1 Tax=Pieris brassicae TaxID=7116 RepID=UPI001E65F973|nr:uncharacterized protein LOC123712064 isoform X1 [Pieris brassicae]
MMAVLWVVLFWASVGLRAVTGLPVGETPQVYPHESHNEEYVGWGSEGGLYTLPALALVLTAVGLLFGCTWCYQHKDCKPNEGADNEIFTESVSHLHDARSRSQPPDSGFSEPVNNNISEDNNNGPISLREMQNIANNNAAVYIVSENEERNRIRESVVEFEPLPRIRVLDPLERCADWFAGDDFPRNRLQYLREIGRGWFGRVVEGEIEDGPSSGTVAVKILNQNASLEDKARFLDEGRMYRDIRHENVLPFIAKCLSEDPWLLMFELCSMDLHQYLEVNRPKMAILNESGVPLQLMCDVTSGLAHLHSRGFLYGTLWSGTVLIRNGETARALLGQYGTNEPQHDFFAPEVSRQPNSHTTSSEVWSVGFLLWEVCAWGATPPRAPPPPHLPCPYRNHLYQVMQLCWNPNPENRPTASQVHALLNHLHTTHLHTETDDHFEERWQRLKPNTIPKIDEHIAIVHAPSTSTDSQFGSDLEFESAQTIPDSLSVGDAAVSRSSSIMSDKEPLSVQIKSESLTNLHGSFEDVRNIYLTHNEAAALECHQGNIGMEEKEHDRSDSSVDPWLKDIITGSQDDVSYFKDVSDVIKNLDNILNSEKTSSSESSHQASPSRDNLSLECKKDYPMQTSLVKSPGIRNFQNISDMGFDSKDDSTCDDDVDRDTIGTLSHSFERHSDTNSQYTLENITPETPIKDFISNLNESFSEQNFSLVNENKTLPREELPNDKIEDSDKEVPKLKELCEALPRLSNKMEMIKDCTSEDNNALGTDIIKDTKSVELIPNEGIDKSELICDTGIDQMNDTTESQVPFSESEINHLNKDALVNEITTTLSDIDQSDASAREENNDLKHIHSESLVQSLTASQTINEVKVITTNTDEDVHEIETNDYVGDHQVEQSCITHTELFLANEIEAQKSQYYESGNQNSVSNDMRDVEKQISYENEDLTQPELIQMTPVTDVQLDEIVNELEYIEDNSIDLETGCASLENVINLGISHATLDNEKLKDLNAKESHIESDLGIESELENVGILAELPDLVQISERATDVTSQESQTESQYSPEKVQNLSKENISSDSQDDTICLDQVTVKYMDLVGSKQDKESASDMSTESTVYMNFSGEQNEISKMYKNEPLSFLESQTVSEADIDKNDSTVYLDLPSVIREMDTFLHAEKLISGHDVGFKDNFHASTPVGSNSSADNVLDSNEHDALVNPNKIADYSAMASEKLEQKGVADTSPFESPTKSHPTDTYDENSSVVLGPFESYTQDTFKSKIGTDLVDLPKEELLAFSSNFSEINLETPSPLRDGNFLNEVPDLIHDDFDDSTSQPKPVVLSDPHTDTDETEEQSTTEKRISPSTPPNSPGNFLASTSQAYIVDIDLDNEPVQHIDINEMDVSQLAIAENENNMNLEYSGPLVEESLNDSITRFNDTLPESFLAGNGGVEETENVGIDEERMKELRNELELKLPLAQVAGIEPASSWTELPPPPELLVTYGALSPIAEETGHQLTAYENDDNWNTSVRTESSESYPEPANNSTDEVTELPTGLASATQQSQHSTYTIHSNATYTLQRDASKEITMSADSLIGSPLKKVPEETASPDADKTYTICDADKESNCERISQVSPFLLSPTTDTSAPSDLHAAVSTLSKATVPTDAKSSKPSETQCLSKATSIDSWCSNDTLYNVEENFDDLAMDPDLPLDFAEPDRDKSESEDTLTHNEDDKELSHCSTYIVHDSRSELCETFSPDSITANDNYTYTKVKTTPSANTKSDLNDSTKNTQTKDLAYGTLGSGMPSFSNCTTELASAFDDTWKLPQLELVRRSPMSDMMNVTPLTKAEDKIFAFDSPEVVTIPKLNKMDSVEITFEDQDKDVNYPVLNDCSNINFKDVINTMTSTPVTEADDNMGEVVPCTLTKVKDGDAEISAITSSFLNEVSPNNVKEEGVNHTSHSSLNTNRISDDKSGISDDVSKFETFMRSAEVRPQELSNNTGVVGYLETTKITCNNSEFPETSEVSSKNFDLFEQSAEIRPQNSNSDSNGIRHKEEILNYYTNDDSSKNTDSFMMSVEMRPQDLSNAYKIVNKETNNIVNAMDDDNSLKSFQSFLDLAETKPQERSYSKSEDQQVSSSNSIPFKVSDTKADDSESSLSLINFQSFIQSAEIRPQDISKTSSERVSSNGEQSDRDNHLSQNSNDSLAVSKKTISYSDFENSASSKPQDMQSFEKSRSDESGVGSEGFRNFEAFARNRPQDLLSLIDASSMLLSSERTTSEHAINSFMNRDITPSTSKLAQEQSVIINPTFASFRDSPDRDNDDDFVTDLDENEQPHSIIITESPLLANINKGHTLDSLGEDSRGSKADEDIEDVNLSSNILEKSFMKDSEEEPSEETKCNGSNQVFATVNFISETFEELLESNVDDNEANEPKGTNHESSRVSESKIPTKDVSEQTKIQSDSEDKVADVTQDFLQNEKNFCQLDAYFPLLSDIRFTGPGTEIMSTSFTQESPTEPTSPECERDSTTEKDKPSELLKEWDSDTDSHSTNSSSGEFIWKDGDGHETALVPNTHFQHQRDNSQPSRAEAESTHEASSVGSGDSGSGSEGDEVEFVPSSWDCRAAPAKSSLRSLEQPADGKKRVVFKRQKYHCVYEYPREASDLDVDSPANYLPDLSTYCEWDPRSAEEAEVGYGQLYGGPSPFDMYPLRAGIAFGADYDEDFYITSTARPFELGVLSTTSQFFPGMHLKQSLLPENDFPPPSPLPPLDPPLTIPRTSLDLTTPDSGVDVTPTIDEDLNEWKPDSTSSSESVSPSSPGGELGGLRHTRDKLKLDLPPSPHLPSPKHNRVFNFVLEKPKRPEPSTPLVMTDETPVMMSLPLIKRDDPMPEPTFSTFGKSTCKSTADQKNIVLTDNENVETVPESTNNPDIKIEEKPDKVEPVKGEGTVLDSGDEDSGIESSSKATLERKPSSNIS